MAHWMNHYKKAGAEFARIPGARGEDMERVGRETGLAYSPTIEAELQTLGRARGVPFPQ